MDVVEGIVLLAHGNHFQVLDGDGAIRRFILRPASPFGHNSTPRQQRPGERVRVLYSGAVDPLTFIAQAVAWLGDDHMRERRVA